jgi:hypothetical protein
MRDEEILGLYDAYLQVHTHQEEVEQLDEAQEARNDPEGYEERQRKSQSSRQRRMNDPHKGINSPAFQEFMAKQMGGKKKKKDTNEQVEVDLFDYILEHLVAEGYADTNEAALAIMANMSGEWRESIVEGVGGYNDPVAGPHTPIGKAVRSGFNKAKNVATKVVNRTVPPNIRSAVSKKAQEVTSGRY